MTIKHDYERIGKETVLRELKEKIANKADIFKSNPSSGTLENTLVNLIQESNEALTLLRELKKKN